MKFYLHKEKEIAHVATGVLKEAAGVIEIYIYKWPRVIYIPFPWEFYGRTNRKCSQGIKIILGEFPLFNGSEF